MSVKTTEVPLGAVDSFPAELHELISPEAHQMGQNCTSKSDSGQECFSKGVSSKNPHLERKSCDKERPTVINTNYDLCWFYGWFVLLSELIPIRRKIDGLFRRSSSNFFVYKNAPFYIPRSALVMKANVSWLVKLNLFLSCCLAQKLPMCGFSIYLSYGLYLGSYLLGSPFCHLLSFIIFPLPCRYIPIVS